jgi:DNA-binding response OmpR family regulator
MRPAQRHDEVALPAVVLADDDVALRALMRVMFVDQGYRVEAYGSGDLLLRALERRFDQLGDPPEVVVTDVRMPGRTGLEVISQLRRFDALTRVVVISGFADAETDLAVRSLGALMLPKPFELDELLRLATL